MDAFINLNIAPIHWADKLCKSFLLRHQRETEFPQQLLLVRLDSACRRILDDSLKKPICKATSYSAGKPTNAVDCEAKQLNSTSCNFWFMQLTYKCVCLINSCKKLKILATIESNISSHVSFCSLSATTAWQTNRKKTIRWQRNNRKNGRKHTAGCTHFLSFELGFRSLSIIPRVKLLASFNCLCSDGLVRPSSGSHTVTSSFDNDTGVGA